MILTSKTSTECGVILSPFAKPAYARSEGITIRLVEPIANCLKLSSQPSITSCLSIVNENGDPDSNVDSNSVPFSNVPL